jgi:REP element-mobilizing transposase RayT
MARLPRLDLPGIPQHVVQRGNNRLPCVLDDGDRARCWQLLAEGLSRTGCALHAWVLMDNHVHLLLTPPAAGAVARLMPALGRSDVGLFRTTRCQGQSAWPAAGGGVARLQTARPLRRPVLKAIPAHRLVLLQVGADLGNLLVRQPFGDQRPPSLGANGADNAFVFKSRCPAAAATTGRRSRPNRSGCRGWIRRRLTCNDTDRSISSVASSPPESP